MAQDRATAKVVKPRLYKCYGVWWVETLGVRAGFSTFAEAVAYVYSYWAGLEARMDLFLIELHTGAYVQ